MGIVGQGNQSYGGFLTLSYLSLFPEGVAASFTCGGIPHVPASASEVYAHTFPRMAAKTQQYYDRYPADVERVAALADAIEEQKPVLPDGSPMTVESPEELPAACDAALQQIEARQYAEDFRDEYDEILCYGIAFYKKRCLVKREPN